MVQGTGRRRDGLVQDFPSLCFVGFRGGDCRKESTYLLPFVSKNGTWVSEARVLTPFFRRGRDENR